MLYKTGPFNFRKAIHYNLEFRDPSFINSSVLCLHLMETPGLTTYVLPLFLMAGKFEYVVKFEDKHYFHKSVVHFRTEPIPPHNATKEQEGAVYKQEIMALGRKPTLRR